MSLAVHCDRKRAFLSMICTVCKMDDKKLSSEEAGFALYDYGDLYVGVDSIRR